MAGCGLVDEIDNSPEQFCQQADEFLVLLQPLLRSLFFDKSFFKITFVEICGANFMRERRSKKKKWQGRTRSSYNESLWVPIVWWFPY